MIYKSFAEKENVTINYKNAKNIQIYKTGGEHSSTNEKTIGNIQSSGQKVSLKKDVSYLLRYDGTDGYDSDEINFSVPVKDGRVDVNPYFSDNKLSTLVDGELAKINNTITSKYPKIGLYRIEKGKMYHYGDWYSTKLTYTGKDAFNSDSLRIVLKKTGNSWEVATNPPNIFLSKYYYKDIPEDVLIETNKL